LDGFIAGRITGPDGNGVPGIRVFVSMEEKPGSGRRGAGDLGGAVTGSNGEFRIDNLLHGPFEISLTPDRTAAPGVSQRLPDEEIEAVSPTDDLVIVLKQ
jgi:hypothetical protein